MSEKKHNSQEQVKGGFETALDLIDQELDKIKGQEDTGAHMMYNGKGVKDILEGIRNQIERGQNELD